MLFGYLISRMVICVHITQCNNMSIWLMIMVNILALMAPLFTLNIITAKFFAKNALADGLSLFLIA
jgi:hypothetical protein